MPLCGVVVVPVEPEDEPEEELVELVAEVVPLVAEVVPLVAAVVPEEPDCEPPLPPLSGFGGAGSSDLNGLRDSRCCRRLW